MEFTLAVLNVFGNSWPLAAICVGGFAYLAVSQVLRKATEESKRRREQEIILAEQRGALSHLRPSNRDD